MPQIGYKRLMGSFTELLLAAQAAMEHNELPAAAVLADQAAQEVTKMTSPGGPHANDPDLPLLGEALVDLAASLALGDGRSAFEALSKVQAFGARVDARRALVQEAREWLTKADEHHREWCRRMASFREAVGAGHNEEALRLLAEAKALAEQADACVEHAEALRRKAG